MLAISSSDCAQVVRLDHSVRGRRILKSVTFEATQGTTVVIGPNGAGKSTLFRLLTTAVPCPRGAINILGHDIGDRRARRLARPLIGYAPQSLDFYGRFRVIDLVSYIGLLKGIPPAKIKQSAQESITRVGLEEKSHETLSNLSGGMLRRAGIAQALVNDPAVLVLDEPTAGLDPGQRRLFRELIKSIGQNRIVLLSTHLTEDVVAFANSVLVLNEGSVAFDGSPADLAKLGHVAGPESERIESGLEIVLGMQPGIKQ